MPMPMPHDDETHDAFMDRCMGDDAMMDEFSDDEQRSAVCNTQWRDSGKGAATRMEHKVFPMRLKSVDDPEGTFSGYASMFDNVDLGGDVIKQGAFKEFVTNGEGFVKVLYSHDSGNNFLGSGTGSGGLPIGLAKVKQDDKGLRFDGRLVMDDPFVKRVHAHLKARSLDGMSIGYDVLPGGADLLESGVRELKALKLWEISPVVWGMNPKAHIADVKSVRSVRELEDLLRDVVGLSKSQAKLHAGEIWRTLTGRRDAGGEVSDDVQQILETFKRFG